MFPCWGLLVILGKTRSPSRGSEGLVNWSLGHLTNISVILPSQVVAMPAHSHRRALCLSLSHLKRSSKYLSGF